VFVTAGTKPGSPCCAAYSAVTVLTELCRPSRHIMKIIIVNSWSMRWARDAARLRQMRAVCDVDVDVESSLSSVHLVDVSSVADVSETHVLPSTKSNRV
jgi:hypothetical protein